jgi:hypothetical protein
MKRAYQANSEEPMIQLSLGHDTQELQKWIKEEYDYRKCKRDPEIGRLSRKWRMKEKDFGAQVFLYANVWMYEHLDVFRF